MANQHDIQYTQEQREETRAKYETGEYTIKELSEEINIPLGTIKGWMARDRKKGTPWIKRLTKIQEKMETGELTERELVNLQVKELIDNDQLTDRQRLFCAYYIRNFNGAKSARMAGYKHASDQAGQLMAKPHVQRAIARLKANRFKGAMLEEGDILQRYIDIAFSDITEFVTFGQREVTRYTDEGKPYKINENYVDFADSKDVDGTIISEIKMGRDGLAVKLHDKMKALQWLSDRMDLVPTVTQEKLLLEQQKVEIAQRRLELDIEGGGNNDKPLEIIIKGKEDIKGA